MLNFRAPWWAPLLAVVSLIACGAALLIRAEFSVQRELAEGRLQAVAELRAAEAEAWVARQMNLAYLLDDSASFADLYLQGERGNVAARTDLMRRVVGFRTANDADKALILDSRGRVLEREDEQTESVAPDVLLTTVRKSIKEGRSVNSGIYRVEGAAMPLRFDVVIPLLKTGTPPRGFLVLRLDPRRSLFPLLAAWPMPSKTGESVLWQRIGDKVVSVSETRVLPAGAQRLSESIQTSALPVARVLRNEIPPGESMQGLDQRGIDISAVVRPVRGTDWWVASKQDLSEVDEPSWRSERWTALAAVFAILGTVLAGRMWQQRRSQADLQRHGEELERLVAERTSALKVAVEALERSRDEAEAATRAKSAFLANMSHEIRTPMNAVIGITHLLLRDIRDAQLRDRVGKIGDAAQHLLGVINDILDLSKIESGKMTLGHADFAINELISKSLELVTSRASDKGLEIVRDTDGLPAQLRGDPVRLSQILINLLPNAVKFTDSGWVRLRGRVLSQQGKVSWSASMSRTPVRASRRIASASCSAPSNRPTTRPRGSTAARGWVSPCHVNWRWPWAATPDSSARREAAATSGSPPGWSSASNPKRSPRCAPNQDVGRCWWTTCPSHGR